MASAARPRRLEKSAHQMIKLLMPELTPLMKQYQDIKERHKDAIVFFRLGDFYEMFGDDARAAARVLQITLTTRDRSKEDPVPMCGVPYFAAESYIAKLVNAGYKVAVCEQMEDPATAKGVVERDVVKVITPGTRSPEDPKENNYMAAFCPAGKVHGMAIADVSTGEFFLFETDNPIVDELGRFEPQEVVYPARLGQDIAYSGMLESFYCTPADDFLFDYTEAYRLLLSFFRVSSLDAFGCEGMSAAISAAGALLAVLKDTQKGALSFERLKPLRERSYMFLDYSTRRNLELVNNLRDGGKEGTLLWALDETLTPMGGRFLRNALLRPLVDEDEIKKRLRAVDTLVDRYESIESIRGALRKVQDLERLSARIQMGSANARDLIGLKNSLKAVPQVKQALQPLRDGLLTELESGLDALPGVVSFISSAINEHPPATLKEGGIIKSGYSRDIDELRSICDSSKDFIAALEVREKTRTGINSLKVGFNRVFGYYIEITRANFHLVPEDYIRKQTLANAERFITPELKEYESKALGAEEKLKALEAAAFQNVLERLKGNAAALSATARELGRLDFLVSLAVSAKRYDYIMPEVDTSLALEIEEGRHPVIERLDLGERFVPNGISLDGDSRRMIVITGPNMAGKSTYMRQNALIVLMAQIGGFVPAARARIGVADRVFTRIGASDFLSMGQSTFMVEMLETANIINNATARSVIVLDEVGRGTSTFDGISIAWAAAEYILENVKARTMFATHYHELTELALNKPGVANCNVAVREWGDEIIFLRRIEDGPADKSYGIQVARLAGLPNGLLEKAKSVLAGLEAQMLASRGMPRLMPPSRTRGQMELFGSRADAFVEEVAVMEDGVSAEHAVEKLADLKKKASELRRARS